MKYEEELEEEHFIHTLSLQNALLRAKLTEAVIVLHKYQHDHGKGEFDHVFDDSILEVLGIDVIDDLTR